MWLGLTMLSFTLCILLKWTLMQRLQPGAFAKYTWAFQTRAVSVGIQVCTALADGCISRQPIPHGRSDFCTPDLCCQGRLNMAQSGISGLLVLTAHTWPCSKSTCVLWGCAPARRLAMSHGFPCVAQDRLVMTGLMEPQQMQSGIILGVARRQSSQPCESSSVAHRVRLWCRTGW